MGVKMMHQASAKHNKDFTAVIKHVAVDLEMTRIIIFSVRKEKKRLHVLAELLRTM